MSDDNQRERKKNRRERHQAVSQFIEILSVCTGRSQIGSVPRHLSAPVDNWERLVVLGIRPEPNESFVVQNISFTRAQAERLIEDLQRVLAEEPLVDE